jgi:hypothetical protein
MKSYTDIEQSKKLAEILPIESADMYYVNSDIDKIIIRKWKDEMHDEDDIPCWSLTALLNILPSPHLSNDKLGGGKTGWMVSVYPDNCRHDSCWHDNPVDACVGMIIKLKELNLL